MKLNKAEKFVKKQFENGLTRNGVREAIFHKLGTWNFPPEYENALANQDPNYDRDNEPLLGVDYMDDVICDDCGTVRAICECMDCHECGEFCVCVDEEIYGGLGHSAEAEEAVFGHKATNHDIHFIEEQKDTDSNIHTTIHDIKCPGEKTEICSKCPQESFCTIITGDSECLFCRKNPCICDTIELPQLPEPGSNDWEKMVDGMRQQLEYMPTILAAKESIEARGKDFNEEFEKWRKKK